MPKVNNFLNNLFCSFGCVSGSSSKEMLSKFTNKWKGYCTFECTVCFITFRLPPSKINRCLQFLGPLQSVLWIQFLSHIPFGNVGPDPDQGQPIFILGNDAKVCCRIWVMHMWYRYLLHISTVVNVFSYAIVFFQHKYLWTRSSGTRQRMPDARGVVVRTVWSMRSILTSLVLAVWTRDCLLVAYPYGTNFPLLLIPDLFKDKNS